MMSRENSSYIHHPSFELTSFLQTLLLKMFKVFADVKWGGNFCHNLNPKYLKECLPQVTVLYLVLYSISTVLYIVLCLYILKCSFAFLFGNFSGKISVIEIMQRTSVHKAGLKCMRVCDSGHRKVFVVCINWCP